MSATSCEEIIDAMKRQEICGYYQPKYDATTGKLAGAEILARWIKPDGSLLLPECFVPVLETCESINTLDWFMVEEACRTIKTLGRHAIPISVNFSRYHIREVDFTARLSALLQKYGTDPALLEIEITESALIDENECILEWINQIHSLHLKVALDDFGSGLSSLQFMKDMPIDILKIDKSLLNGNCATDKERIVLESIFYFANRLNLDTVAEGVETEEQLGFLKTCDCKKIQGYFFAKPMPSKEFVALCKKNAVKKTDSLDILEFQTPVSATQLLLSAIFQKYPLVIFANLTKNSYYMMSYDNFTTTECSGTGKFDELIQSAASTIHPEDREAFVRTFDRENLLKIYRSGTKAAGVWIRQRGDDGIYREIESMDYFVKNPSSNDVLAINFSGAIEERR